MGMKRQARCRVLLIGPLPPADPNFVNPIGGGPLNFAEMIRELSRRNISLEIINVSRGRTHLAKWLVVWRDVTKFVSLLWSVLRRMKSHDAIFFNTSARRSWITASVLWMICKIGHRPMVLRFFGGDFRKVYESQSRLNRWWVENTYLTSALIFVQTDEIYRHFRGRGNFRWFPNTRDLVSSVIPGRTRPTKMLFLSRLYMDKGLSEAVYACRNLPEDIRLSVYGPLMPDTDVSLFSGDGRVTYHGAVDPKDVPSVLRSHDILLFPSYWRSEGHPGVVIEALQCGLPVVATRWAGIPEIVEHEESGLLVEPRSALAVEAAVSRLIEDPTLYRRLSEGARIRGEYFRSERWYGRMADELEELVGRSYGAGRCGGTEGE